MKLPSNEMKIFSANKMLQADIMYDQIVQTVNKTEKRLTIKRVPLNYIELQKILTQKVKVFFMLCHGENKNDGKFPPESYFALENKDEPTLLD